MRNQRFVARYYASDVVIWLSRLSLGLFILLSHTTGAHSAPSASKESIAHARTSGLVAQGDAIASFKWSVEIKKPFGRARLQVEEFSGGVNLQEPGITAVLRARYEGVVRDNSKKISEFLSARNLVTLHDSNEEVLVSLSGLSWPIEGGRQFDFNVKDEHGSLTQRCTVLPMTNVSQVHAQIPGVAFPIDCSGNGRYRGFKVAVKSRVWYFPKLGVFFHESDVIQSPLGQFATQATIKEFELLK